MSIIRKIKQRFCRHIDNPDNRNYQMSFAGYEFQCPKCGSYVAYFADHEGYTVLSELQHNIAIEEGKKYWMAGQKYEDSGEL